MLVYKQGVSRYLVLARAIRAGAGHGEGVLLLQRGFYDGDEAGSIYLRQAGTTTKNEGQYALTGTMVTDRAAKHPSRRLRLWPLLLLLMDLPTTSFAASGTQGSREAGSCEEMGRQRATHGIDDRGGP